MESKQYAFVNNNTKEEVVITTGDTIKVKTKDESIIGKVSNLTSNYLILEVPKSNINIYKDILYVDLLEIKEEVIK